MADRILKSSLPISFLVHIAFALLLMFLSTRPSDFPKDETLWIDLDSSQSDQRQIVQSNKGEKVKEAPEKAYLGEANRIVKEETIGREGLPQKSQPKAEAPKEQAESVAKDAPLAKFGIPLKYDSAPKAQESPEWVDFSKTFGEVFPDYVKGLKQGEQTALNTKEFVYFSYYKRIRDQLDQAWRPILRDSLYQIVRAGRRLASDQDHITKTLVTLDRSGDVVRVQVLEESGVRDLDRSAVEAFNRAGPFPNPPKGLINPEGQITLRWDFILRS